jgi:hypothetical protein
MDCEDVMEIKVPNWVGDLLNLLPWVETEKEDPLAVREKEPMSELEREYIERMNKPGAVMEFRTRARYSDGSPVKPKLDPPPDTGTGNPASCLNGN